MTLDVAKVAQTLSRGIDRGGSRANSDVEDTHHWHLHRLLRGGRERRDDENAS
ncbi:MAG TPA: hypothetical protein VGT81_23165 [Casimicrobiaceae bacterium]|nr:hypothetical protein [Casimicrobiaceae bacterium]